MAQENIIVDLIDGSLAPDDIYVNNAFIDVDSVLHLQRENAEELTVDFVPMIERFPDTHVSSGSFSNRTKQLVLKFNTTNVSDVTIDLSTITTREFGGKNYDPTHVYDVGDLVSSPVGNKIYLALTSPQTGAPGTVGSGWTSASASGDKGDKGDPGIQGPPGPEGPAGSGVYIRGSDTVVNILGKPYTYGDMWIAEDSGTDDIGTVVAPGDGLISGSDKWISVGPVRGPIGPMGPQGNDGADGTDGIDGSDGQQGLTGPEGPTGPQGADGRSVLNGTVNPTAGVGLDGDFYINTTTYYIYGPKIGGAWGPGTPLEGEDGIDGIDGTDGAAGPQGIPGEKGDTGEGIPPGGVETDVITKGPGDEVIWKSIGEISGDFVVSSNSVDNTETRISFMVFITQADYDAIGTGNYQSDKLYIIAE